MNEAAKQFIADGVQRHLAGDLEQAAAAYRAALQRDPDSATAHNNLGFVLGQAQQWQAAREHLEQALRLKPDMAMAHSNLGQVLVACGETRQGLQHLQRATELAPQDLQAWENLSSITLQLGDARSAEIACRQTCRIAPRQGRLFTRLGTALSRQGRHDEAVVAHQQATRLSPGDADAWGQLGVSLFLRQDLGSARQALGKALAIEPGHYIALRHLALVQTTSGDRPAAIDTLRQLSEHHPLAHDARLDLAVLLLSADRATEACPLLESLHATQPEDERTRFYLALAWRHSGNQQRGDVLLQELAQQSSIYGERAQQLVRLVH